MVASAHASRGEEESERRHLQTIYDCSDGPLKCSDGPQTDAFELFAARILVNAKKKKNEKNKLFDFDLTVGNTVEPRHTSR